MVHKQLHLLPLPIPSTLGEWNDKQALHLQTFAKSLTPLPRTLSSRLPLVSPASLTVFTPLTGLLQRDVGPATCRQVLLSI